MNRTLTLKRGKERVIANRHPWIFAGAIHTERGPEDAPVGDLVDPDGTRIASGFYSRSSQIRLRALTFGETAVTPELIAARLSEAIARRRPIFGDTTNAARLVHAEGDELSSIVVDRYDDVLVVEIANRGAEHFKPIIIETLRRELQPRAIFFKNDLPARKLEGLSTEDESVILSPAEGEGPPAETNDPRLTAGGPSPSTRLRMTGTTILESGLRFRVDPAEGQKTGFFLDQRENRRLARTLAAGRRVLNLFSYSGAFGVYAGAGGAASVTNVDVSAPAIEAARENAALNGVEAEHVVADAFQYVRQKHGPFDLLICDPPPSRNRGTKSTAPRAATRTSTSTPCAWSLRAA